MKVNLGVELSDGQRMVLASLISGKPVKRLASRDDVRDFLYGVVAGLDRTDAELESQTPILPGRRVTHARGAYTVEEQTVAGRLAGEGRNPEYIRGWISAGRVLTQSGHKFRQGIAG